MFIVPQVFAMMVDLEEEEDWALQDEVENEDEERYDGWMTCYFTSFSTVFQSCQDNGMLIMKGCVQWNTIYR